MPLETLSPSRAGDYKHCPRLFAFRVVDRLEEPVSVQQARGTTAHLALQRLFDLPPSDRVADRLYSLFREAWSELRSTEPYSDLFAGDIEAERRWGLSAMSLLANYFALENPGEFDPLERELEMLEEIDGMVIRGILDRLDRRSDNRLVVTDYKSGAAPAQRFARPAFFGLKVYSTLVRRSMGETPAEIRLLYLTGPTIQRMQIDDVMLDGVETQLRALWDAIDRALETGDFPARPGRRCSWCPFRDRCPANATASGPPGDLAGVA